MVYLQGGEERRESRRDGGIKNVQILLNVYMLKMLIL